MADRTGDGREHLCTLALPLPLDVSAALVQAIGDAMQPFYEAVVASPGPEPAGCRIVGVNRKALGP